MFVKDFAGDQTMHMDGKLEGFSTIDLLGSPSLKSEFCCFYQSSSHKIPIGSTEKFGILTFGQAYKSISGVPEVSPFQKGGMFLTS